MNHRVHYLTALLSAIGWIALQETAFAVISNNGLLAEYAFETSGGVAVADGQSAAEEQIDDTGLNVAGPNHATGSAFVPGSIIPVLTYSDDVPAAIGSGRSLDFPTPESNLNYVSVPIPQGSALDNIATGDFRIEAWFKTTDSNRANIFASFIGGSPNNAFNLELFTADGANPGGRVRIYLQQGSTVEQINAGVEGITYFDNEWHQLIAARDEGTLALTLDGNLVGSIPSTTSFEQNVTEFRIGQDNRGASTPKFTGQLDNIRLYSGPSTSSPPVAFYDFDTSGGVATFGDQIAGTVDDTAGHGDGPFDGTGFPASAGQPNGEPQYRADVPAVLAGSSSYSMEFQETTAGREDATFPVTTELAAVTLGDFSIETWFKTTDTNRSALVSGWQDATNRAVGLELHTSNRVRLFMEGGAGQTANLDLNVAPSINTRDGQWHHAVGRREAGVVSVWVDGEKIGEVSDIEDGTFEMAVALMRLGNDNRGGGLPYDGSLDNSRIWTRALSDEEIGELAAGGTPVPEPGSLALLMFAVAGASASVRRRRGAATDNS